MSSQLRGTPGAPGVAVAAPWVHRTGDLRAGPAALSLTDAASAAAAEVAGLARTLRAQAHEEEADILDAQSLMAMDPALHDAAAALIASGADPAAAIVEAGEAVATSFEAIDDEILAARGVDVRDITERIARLMTGTAAPRLERRSVVVAADLPPSVTVELDRALLVGIALEGGSRTSHAAILSRSLGIPAVVGVGGLQAAAVSAEELGIDGDAGIIYLDPDSETRARLAALGENARTRAGLDVAFATTALATADGHRVICAANIGEPGEAEAAFASGAEAIGLFRTEFAFAGRRSAPDQDMQASAYADVLRTSDGAEVVFRLVDIGGDKPIAYLATDPEENPFLGVRAIRLAERYPELLPTQLRAILRASQQVGHPASIMAPMVADEEDLELVLRLVDEARESAPDAPRPRVGIMVEVPSAVLLADRLAARVEFMSIGTNDLTQYLLAADRSNAALASRQDPLHPAVLRAISHVTTAVAGVTACRVAVCGEMAGDAVGAQVLVGLGVDELSMDPRSFGVVKRAVGARTLPELKALAVESLSMKSAAEVRQSVESAS